MESNDLHSASTYVNNLLLARGLLRDGKTIDFGRLAQPTERRKRKHQQLRFEDADEHGREKKEKGDDDTYKITTQVLNLVHDLILKRDRDISTQESTSQTLISLRSEAASFTSQTQRLETQKSDLKRQLATSEASARAAEAAARAAEASAKGLRDEAARCKTILAQVKMSCANDVRKRDLELSRLKAHLTSEQRGVHSRSTVRGGSLATSNTSASIVAPTCTISRGVGASLGNSNNRTSSTCISARNGEAQTSVQDAEYTLQQETNEFLTQLSQSLSDENDALIALVRDTLASLRDLQGISELPTAMSFSSDPQSISVSSSANHDGLLNHGEIELVNAPPATYTALAEALTPVLHSLRELLSTPSFVSIEEVHTRDEEIVRLNDEIVRLKDGWEKMESRWKDAAGMMQGWRRRMVGGGDTVNLKEVRAGLRLGEGLNVNGVGSSFENEEDGEEAGFSEVVGEESVVERETVAETGDEIHGDGEGSGAVDESILDASLATGSFSAASAASHESSAASASDPATSDTTPATADESNHTSSSQAPTTDSPPPQQPPQPSTTAPPIPQKHANRISISSPSMPLFETSGNINSNTTNQAESPTKTAKTPILDPGEALVLTPTYVARRHSIIFRDERKQERSLHSRGRSLGQEQENLAGNGDGSEDELAS